MSAATQADVRRERLEAAVAQIEAQLRSGAAEVVGGEERYSADTARRVVSHIRRCWAEGRPVAWRGVWQ